MAQGKCAILLLVLTLAACAERPAPPALGDTDPVREWLATSADQPSPASTPTSTSAPPVNTLIVGLEQRLAADPSDVSGWRLLAQSHAYLGDMAAARAAAERAVGLGADSDELDALILTAHSER